jgi:hypothetical protein
MNVLRILRLADALYGEDTRRRIFEPLAADLQRELAGPDGSPKLTLRWRVAVIAAFVQCTPRAFTNRMPRGLWSEVALCVIGFGALAFAWQQFMNGRSDTGTRTWTEIAAASLSFVVIPAVWRIRVSALLQRKRRTRMLIFVALIAMVQAVFGEGGWAARSGLAASAPLLAFIGWQLRNDERERMSALAANPFIRLVMVASTLMIASWPAKLALGVGILDPRWNGDRFVSYLLAALVIVTMGRRIPEDYSPGTRSA